jgi:plastocyanin
MMSRRIKAVSALTAAALCAGLLAAGSPASAQATLTVQEGAHLQARAKAPAEGMLFYAPRPLRVHPGDTITFNIKGFHTATLIPANTPIDQWVSDNTGQGGQYALVEEDPDDGAFKFNNNAFLPSNPSCGTEGSPACNYGGSQVLNSGGLFDSKFSVTVNANAGSYFYVICLVHPAMRLRVEVVGDLQETTTQADINAFKQAKTAAEAKRARRVHRRFSDEHEKTRRPNGTVVWEAYAGIDRKGFSLYDFYPQKLKVRKGHKVGWRFDELIYEDHTVTFPRRTALRVAASGGGVPVCDPDGDNGPGPDNPPDSNQPPFCNDPGQLELDISKRFALQRGNARHKRLDYDSSGVRGAAFGTDPYNLKFTRRTSRKGIKYICLIHPFMVGKVAVRR